MRKRLLCRAVCALLALTLLTGCGGPLGSASGAPAGTPLFEIPSGGGEALSYNYLTGREDPSFGSPTGRLYHRD